MALSKSWINIEVLNPIDCYHPAPVVCVTFGVLCFQCPKLLPPNNQLCQFSASKQLHRIISFSILWTSFINYKYNFKANLSISFDVKVFFFFNADAISLMITTKMLWLIWVKKNKKLLDVKVPWFAHLGTIIYTCNVTFPHTLWCEISCWTFSIMMSIFPSPQKCFVLIFLTAAIFRFHSFFF